MPLTLPSRHELQFCTVRRCFGGNEHHKAVLLSPNRSAATPYCEAANSQMTAGFRNAANRYAGVTGRCVPNSERRAGSQLGAPLVLSRDGTQMPSPSRSGQWNGLRLRIASTQSGGMMEAQMLHRSDEIAGMLPQKQNTASGWIRTMPFCNAMPATAVHIPPQSPASRWPWKAALVTRGAS